MSEPSPGAVIWDVDGTLVDTAELHFRAWVELCHGLGRDFTRADFAATFGRRNPEIIRHLSGDRFDDAAITELGDRKEDLYKSAARQQGVSLLPGARELLEGLHAAAFRQAIGSSAPRGNVDLIMEMTDTARFFGAISSAEDTQRGKPRPAGRAFHNPPRRPSKTPWRPAIATACARTAPPSRRSEVSCRRPPAAPRAPASRPWRSSATSAGRIGA